MILTMEQSERFFDTMDALLIYVNERFQVVEGFTLDYSGQIGDMKTALVARTLWENVEVIDDFVRDNPTHLPKSCLNSALAWKCALPGLYTLVRYQNGRAILMNDAGIFSICGVTLELEGEIGPAPAFVEIVLLPFEGEIIYDGFIQVLDSDGSLEEATRIQDEFENRCSGGIVSTAADFERVAEAHLTAKRDKELQALLDDVAREAAGEAEELPAGFHRGALAGLDMIEREAAIAAHLAESPGAAGTTDAADVAGMAGATDAFTKPVAQRTHKDMQADQAVNCAIASVLSRGIVEIGDAYQQYTALAPDPLTLEEFDTLVRYEASFPDSYFGLWSFQGHDYLQYYTLTPDYLAQTASKLAARANAGLDVSGSGWRGLRAELEYYERYRAELLEARREIAPKPLSRTLLENTPLGELLRDESVARLRRFLDERIPDGQDDYLFADLAAQEFALMSIETGSLEELYRLAEELGVADCCADDTRLPRLVTNVFNAMPSWENNGWSPQDLYEQLTGRHMFYNDDGSLMKVGRDEPCPCGSGLKYRECHGR